MAWLSMLTRVGFSAILVLFSFSANAFDFGGAWATDASKCSNVFVKKKNGISLTRKSDFFGGGFVVGGDKISGAELQNNKSKRRGRYVASDYLVLNYDNTFFSNRIQRTSC